MSAEKSCPRWRLSKTLHQRSAAGRLARATAPATRASLACPLARAPAVSMAPPKRRTGDGRYVVRDLSSRNGTRTGTAASLSGSRT